MNKNSNIEHRLQKFIQAMMTNRDLTEEQRANLLAEFMEEMRAISLETVDDTITQAMKKAADKINLDNSLRSEKVQLEVGDKTSQLRKEVLESEQRLKAIIDDMSKNISEDLEVVEHILGQQVKKARNQLMSFSVLFWIGRLVFYLVVFFLLVSDDIFSFQDLLDLMG